jgi:hypothetical protein
MNIVKEQHESRKASIYFQKTRQHGNPDAPVCIYFKNDEISKYHFHPLCLHREHIVVSLRKEANLVFNKIN